MVDVVYDKRIWHVEIESDDCPFLYYPSNLHGCKLSEHGEGECRLELCPRRIKNKDNQANSL